MPAVRRAYRYIEVNTHESMIRMTACAIAVALASFTAPAFGQDAGTASTVGREEERLSLYRQGLTLAELGRWDEALQKFQEVVSIRSAPRALFALATAEEKSGRLVGAKRTFAKTQADADAIGDKDLVQKATAEQVAVESRLPHVVIHLPLDAVGAQITFDDMPQPATPEAFEIDPGEHRIVVNAMGMQSFEERFRVAEREQKDLIVTLSPLETPPADIGEGLASSFDAPAEPTEPVGVVEADPASAANRHVGAWPGPSWPASALGGVGIAATVVGVIVTANGKATYDDVGGGCPAHHCPTPEAAHRGNAARDRMLAGTITAGTGVLAIAGAALWWVLSASSVERRANASGSIPPASAGPAFSLRVEVLPGTEGGWVRVGCAF
jgi:hypothetical protein